MGFGFTVRIRGETALFTDPASKAERFSYSTITPSAARGMIEAIFWHPGMRYVIDEIQVNNQIRYDSIRRNEVGSVPKLGSIKKAYTEGGAFYLDSVAERQQRASAVLRNVDYCVKAHFELVPEKCNPGDDEKKFFNMIIRRLRKGQFHAPPYLGTREFPGTVTLMEEGDLMPESFYKDVQEHDLGFMLYDLKYGKAEAEPIFFHAVMRRGVIRPEVQP